MLLEALKLETVGDVNNFFADWYNFSEKTRLETIRKLKEFGSLSVVSKTVSRDDFQCPTNKFSLARPCSLGECHYFIDSFEGRNCLINCLTRAKNNRLSNVEISHLLKISPSDINSINNQSINKIRKAVIKEKLERVHISRFSYLDGHCVTCETNIINELEMGMQQDLIIEYGKHGWCSIACKKEKPKWQFLIEKEFGCHYEDALTVAYTIYRRPEIVDDIFNLNSGVTLSLRTKLRKRMVSF